MSIITNATVGFSIDEVLRFFPLFILLVDNVGIVLGILPCKKDPFKNCLVESSIKTFPGSHEVFFSTGRKVGRQRRTQNPINHASS